MTGKHLLLDAWGITSEFVLTDITHTWRFLYSIPEIIKLKPIGFPIVTEALDRGADGVTGVLILTTSHTSIHLWSNGVRRGRAHFDVFSCQDFDDNEVVCEFERIYRPEQFDVDVRRRI